MRPLSILGMVISMIVWVNVSVTQSLPTPLTPPKDVIEDLWGKAVRGELLTPEGWKRASYNYADRTPWTGNKVVVVMSNDYAFDHASINGNAAKAAVTCDQLGRLDSALRYTPLPPEPYFKTGLGYDLVVVASHILVSAPGEKKAEEKVNPKVTYWKIQGSPGPPWTTVNTAIRYVLEMREKATDPAIKNNADQTIAKLLRLH
jgi:hypothetical protein